MNIGLLLILSLPVYFLAYRFYGKFISRVFNENDKTPTPAVAMKDDVDYVPTKLEVIFSHHFASIAGAGPIIGPTIALIFGYLPVFLWVVLGTVFIGAVQDYTALFVSIREKGHSIAEVADRTLGRFGFFLLISFTIIMLVYVTSAFLALTTISLTSMVPLEAMKVGPGETILKTITGSDGIVKARIGGIASTSVIIMTLCAPFIGFLLYKKQRNVAIVGLFALVIGMLAIIIGVVLPVTLDPKIWMILLTLYVIVAARVPVWMLLQPRDFTNSFLLYIGIFFLFIGVISGGFMGIKLQAPALNIAEGTNILGSIWPFLFITVACGAISGFHALVAGGTISKQITRESDARKIGYGGMLLESLLAVLVILTVAGGLDFTTYSSILNPAGKGTEGNPILAFALSMGALLNKSLGLPVAGGTVFGILLVEGFVITTLDTAVRLNRYLFEELWSVLIKKPPKIFRSYMFNASLSAGLMLLLCYTNSFKQIWPVFGSANQLLAALTLIVVSVWLAQRKKATFFTILPAIFMMVTTIYSLWQMLTTQYMPQNKHPLSITAFLLILLSIGVIFLATNKLSSHIFSRRKLPSHKQ
ncbi:MAG: carbon starvation protein A [Candidatus Omnitrophica bacterium]|jgi:carbon starvation protein|nr:carbon starvation protein A [Candidatus Omnitrophota bacterium]MDD5079637.1 carbon starvation protein A [Candidatus Omnitrophota bacterium]